MSYSTRNSQLATGNWVFDDRVCDDSVCDNSVCDGWVCDSWACDSRLAAGSPLPASGGLTLIELLVVIVILTTLVGGVIPILSPNNDTRKISAAARGLQGYITLVQTRAAHTGRPHGIAFRESSAGSGAALEVFGLEVPPLFAGFSTESRVWVTLSPRSALGQPPVYNPGARDNFRFHPQFNGAPLYRLAFVLANRDKNDDWLPPRTFRIGDSVDIDGNQFRMVDTAWNVNRLETVGTATSEVMYLGSSATPASVIECVWVNSGGQVAPQGLKRYQIARQPTNSSESPYQLPAGIAIDMQGSVAEGSQHLIRFPSDKSLYTNNSPPRTTNDTVGIMFSSTGSVSNVILNGIELATVSRVILLLGRVENSGLQGGEWVMDRNPSKDTLEQKQTEINWLNLDSRLLSIATRNGRSVVSEPAFFDGTRSGGEDDEVQASKQIEAAHAFAHEMTTVGGK